jgi:hypothetical protein
MTDPTDLPEEELDIELTEQPPACRYAGRKAAEPCWGPVVTRPEFPDTPFRTCAGHACTDFNGRYYTEGELIKARKTGGRLYPTFQPIAKAVLPDVDPELVTLWYLDGDGDRAAAMNRATREAEALCMVNDVYGRTKLPRDSANNPPPPQAPLQPISTATPVLGKVVSGDGLKIVTLKE